MQLRFRNSFCVINIFYSQTYAQVTSFPDIHKKNTRDHFCKASSSQTKACTLFLRYEQHIKTSFYILHENAVQATLRYYRGNGQGEGINVRSEAIWNGVTEVTFSKLWMATVVTLLSTLNKRSHKYERPLHAPSFRVNKLNVQR